MLFCRNAVVFLLVCLAIAADAKHHQRHHHKHNDHMHHSSMMLSTTDFFKCANRGDFDTCLTAHADTMDKCIEGARPPFDSEKLPGKVIKFVGCFKTLKSCVTDGDDQACTDAMLKCVGVAITKKQHATRCKMMKKMPSVSAFKKHKKMMAKGRKNHLKKLGIPMPIQLAIKEYTMCKCRAEEKPDDKFTSEKCTEKKIAKVTEIMNWAKLERCEMKAVLCQYDASAEVDCLAELKSCMGDTTPEVPENAPQHMAEMFTKMASAKKCYTDNTAAGCTADTCTTDKYLSCVVDDSKWIKNEGKHVYCFGKVKSCAADTGKAGDVCSTEYSACLGKHAESKGHGRKGPY